MDRERKLATRELLRAQEFRLQELMESIPGELGAFVPPDEVTDQLLTAMVELEDLRNELEFLQDDSSEPGEPDALVGAPVKPAPRLSSGAIALPEPE